LDREAFPNDKGIGKYRPQSLKTTIANTGILLGHFEKVENGPIQADSGIKDVGLSGIS